jgi:5-formyltetrahydrofolate cyclo-ligase
LTADIIADEKNRLRRYMRRLRDGIPVEQRNASAQAAAERGLDFLLVISGLTVSGYWPVRGEFDCLPLLERLERDGCRLALPVIVKGQPLEFHAWSRQAPLVPGPFTIPVPASQIKVEPDILLVPLLAFDTAFHRLGYGAGDYDRTLHALRQRRPITAIGLGFDMQCLPHVPAGAHDVRLDWLLTPTYARKRET